MSKNKSRPVIKQDDKITWVHQEGDQYLVIGIDCNGKRFRVLTSNWEYARSINVWRGNRWLIRKNKRHRVGRINN